MTDDIAVAQGPIPTLDPAQEIRIAAVHRGFLYQHLFTVGCVLTAARVGASAVVVERDEDVEIVLPTGRLYVQVKSRTARLNLGDIESALERFDRLRDEHATGRRKDEPQFVIVASQPPNGPLASWIASEAKQPDVHFLWPGAPVPASLNALPPAFQSIDAAASWCTKFAAQLPQTVLAPDSLVWKLAGRVMAAAAGKAPHANHTFAVETLPDLFEQLLVQLQEFPAPLPSYRAQAKEPKLESGSRIRLVCGFSGAGKTSWIAQAAQHSSENCVYFDASDTPGPSLASSLVRELAARLLEVAPSVARQVLLPGASGIESLQGLDTHIGRQGRSPIVVLDNAHHVPAENLHAVIKGTSNLRFVLLCQPLGSTRELEGLLNIRRETLNGWDLDTVASEVVAIGAIGSAAAMGQLRAVTAGMPLYVQSAARVAVHDYQGDIAALCAALDNQTNIAETSQEIILSRVLDGLPARIQQVVAILSTFDVVLTLAEVNKLLAASLGLSAAAVAASIRELRPLGVVEIFGAQQLKLHDAMRVLGCRLFEAMEPEQKERSHHSLKKILATSLTEERNTSRFSLYVRVLIALKEVETIIDLANLEMFHEMGLGNIFLSSLEEAGASTDLDPDQRFWALDGLVFALLKEGEHTEISKHFKAMATLLGEHSLGGRCKFALKMKQMLFSSKSGDLRGVRVRIHEMNVELPPEPQYQRIFNYNAAVALQKLRQFREAEELIDKVIADYFELLGISEHWIFLKKQDQLRPLLTLSDTSFDDVKHLADALEVRAQLLRDRQCDPKLWPIFAMKFYELVGAIDSLVRVGQDTADDSVARQDFEGARQILEQHVIPYAEHYKMLDRIVAIRSQYAVVLAHCRRFAAAEKEIEQLEVYAGGFNHQQRMEVDNQRRFIAGLRVGNASAQQDVLVAPMRIRPPVEPRQRVSEKVGRNELCPCGSGLKHKKCHGAG